MLDCSCCDNFLRETVNERDRMRYYVDFLVQSSYRDVLGDVLAVLVPACELVAFMLGCFGECSICAMLDCSCCDNSLRETVNERDRISVDCIKSRDNRVLRDIRTVVVPTREGIALVFGRLGERYALAVINNDYAYKLICQAVKEQDRVLVICILRSNRDIIGDILAVVVPADKDVTLVFGCFREYCVCAVLNRCG